jgi:hypothetical protein
MPAAESNGVRLHYEISGLRVQTAHNKSWNVPAR